MDCAYCFPLSYMVYHALDEAMDRDIDKTPCFFCRVFCVACCGACVAPSLDFLTCGWCCSLCTRWCCQDGIDANPLADFIGKDSREVPPNYYG